jgi:hypothetical protein
VKQRRGGVRFFLFDDLQADIGVAVPLTYRAPDNNNRSARFCSRSQARSSSVQRGNVFSAYM